MQSVVPHSTIVSSEAIQRKAWRMLSCAAPAPLASTLGIRMKEAGSTLYHAALEVPGAQFNKVFSFGLDGDGTPAAIDAASDWLRHMCPEQSLLMVPPTEGQDDIDRELLRHGFQRFPLDITIFHMDADVAPEVSPSSGIDVRSVSPEEAGLFGQVLSEGLGSPVADEWLAAYSVGHPGLTAYLAFDGPTAIGAAGLLVDSDWGWLFIAAVRPAYRNRGAQTALLARRIADGRKAGVRTFNIGAMRPAAGHTDVFASYRNIERAGFKIAYHRPNYTLAA